LPDSVNDLLTTKPCYRGRTARCRCKFIYTYRILQ